jgi:hypothetical protein
MTVVAMSHGELSRFDTLMRVERGALRVEDAALLLGLKRRQIFRLLERLRAEGASGLVSRKRGRPSNRRHSDSFRERILSIVREHYVDFGPTLAREYLAERHDIAVGCETLRQMMIEAGIWQDRAARRSRPYQPRHRRECRGELIQIDGSDHEWFEDRGPRCTLLVYIDDATSELMHLKMVESESTFSYMEATREYIERHGKPVAFYSDKHTVFRNPKATAKGDGMTHFGRAEHRDYLRQLTTGQGSGRAGERHVARSAGQGDAAGGHLLDRRSQCVFGQLDTRKNCSGFGAFVIH